MGSGLREPIAVVGTACRFPGESNSVSKLWELLKEPRDVSQEIPTSRFNIDRFYHRDGAHHGTTNTRRSYFLTEDIAQFDHKFFSIPAGEAAAIDPQQRLLLEVTYEALESGGYRIEQLQGSNTSVYVGMMSYDYYAQQTQDLDFLPTYNASGTANSNSSSRMSYFFDWHGPSMTIDTACSSSLVAVYQAVAALRSGTSRMAVAAGTNLLLFHYCYVAESNLGMLSPDGQSRMWDEAANGYARGEGVATVLLKTLSAALEDGDEIHCVIRDIGIGHDGRTTGLTMPSASAQAALIREVYINAGLNPDIKEDRCQYFEAHGTGTPAGDPQEAEALNKAFFTETTHDPDDVLYVGSLKTVIGHIEGTAGLAGLLKACMALKHGIITPNMLFNRLNPRLEPFVKHLKIPTSIIPWPPLPKGTPRRVSINSFGFGGANAHAILESYEAHKQDPPPPFALSRRSNALAPIPFSLSAAGEDSLVSYLEKFLGYLEENLDIDPASLAHALHSRKSCLPCRTAFSAASIPQLVDQIKDELSENATKGKGRIVLQSTSEPSIIGIFTGQGAQWKDMGKQLIVNVPLVSEILEELDSSLSRLPEEDRPPWKLAEAMSSSTIGMAEVSQPICTAMQIVLVDLLALAGVKFAAVVGHSSGEIGAAYAAGMLTKADAIRIAYYRGLVAKLAKGPMAEQGAMMAVGTSIEDALELCGLEDFKGRLCVAAENSQTSVTLSGDASAIENAKLIFDEEEKFARQLKVDTAYHSHHMEPCLFSYEELLRKCKINVLLPPQTAPKWFSSVHQGKVMTPCEGLRSKYWVDNMRQTVLFHRALNECISNHDSRFTFALELGPHPALKGPAVETLQLAKGGSPPYSGTLNRGKDDWEAFKSALGALWTHNGPNAVDFISFERACLGRNFEFADIPKLPSYAWHHDKQLLAESRYLKTIRSQPGTFHDLLGILTAESTPTELRWRNVLKVKELPWLSGHALQGQTVFPATAYMALAMEAAVQIAGSSHIRLIEICDFDILKAISIDDNAPTELVVSMGITAGAGSNGPEDVRANFAAHSSVANQSDSMLALNCQGRVRIIFETSGQNNDSVLSSRSSVPVNLSKVDIEGFYTTLREDIGYYYEGLFRGITSLERKPGLATGYIANPLREDGSSPLLFHPAMADSALQGIFAAVSAPGDGMISSIRVPKSCQRITIVPPLCGQHMPEEVAFDCTLTGDKLDLMLGDVEIYTPDFGQKIIEIEGLALTPFTASSIKDDRCMFQESVWYPNDPDGELAVRGRRPSAEQNQKALDAERASFYYLKKIHLSVDSIKRGSLPWYRQSLLDFAEKVYNTVLNGEHDFANDWLNDTYEQILLMMLSYGDDANFNIIRAVGDNILRSGVLVGEENILEYMRENDYLDRYYEKAEDFSFLNESIGEMMAQLKNKFPHMHICEIGAGTGGATKAIFDHIGLDFASYTYTDISSGFFEPAQAKFKHQNKKMVYKTLNIENDPIDQEFAEHSFDCVIAANVLHATKFLEQTMHNVRRLLKPGGYLFMFEGINSTGTQGVMRFGAVMGGLPGWWVGRDDGRQYAPNVSLSQWDDVFKRTGFSGIETFTPMLDPITIPQSIFCTMALDDKINILRNPMSHVPDASTNQSLVIVGADAPMLRTIIDDLTIAFKPHFAEILIVETLDALEQMPKKAQILGLADCSGSISDNMSRSRWKALQLLLESPESVLWVTCGATRDNIGAATSVGLFRNLYYEMPGVAIHLLEFPELEDINVNTITSLALQIKYTMQFKTEGKSMQWTVEPELRFMNGKLEMLRVQPQEEQNSRLSASQRPIYRISDNTAQTKRLEPRGSSFVLTEESQESLKSEAKTRVVRVSTSLLRSIKIPTGYVFVSLGTDEHSGEKVLCISGENASRIVVHESWTVPVNSEWIVDSQHLSMVVAELVLHEIIRFIPMTGSVLCHELHPGLTSLLSKQLGQSGRLTYFTSADPDVKYRVGNWTYIHDRSTQREVAARIPFEVSCYVDGSSGSAANNSLSTRLEAALSPACEKMRLFNIFRASASPLPKTAPESIVSLLHYVNASATNVTNSIPDTAPLDTLPLSAVTTSSAEDMTLVDWLAETKNLMIVNPITARNDLFRNDKTYWLAGMSGDLARSLADFMILHGARHVALSSRNPPVDKSWVSWHKSNGAQVQYFQNDITDFTSIDSTYENIISEMPTIGGIANGAMVLADKLFRQMTVEEYHHAIRPKIEGTKNLIRLLEDKESVPLEWFIALASFVATRGNPGQTNYAAANCGMKALINQRRASGLAASSIDISLLVGVGYIERETRSEGRWTTEQKNRLIAGSTSIPMSETDMHHAFAEAIVAGRPNSGLNHEIITGIAPVVRETANMAHWPGNPKFGLLVRDGDETMTESGTHTAKVPVKELLKGAQSLDEMNNVLKDALSAKLRLALFSSASDAMPQTTPLIDFGVDSLVAVEIRGWLLKELASDIPVMKILGGMSIEELAGEILSTLQGDIVDRFVEAGGNDAADLMRDKHPEVTLTEMPVEQVPISA